MVTVPEASHRAWASVLLADRSPPLENIAIRMVIVRLRILLNRDRAQATIARCCWELRQVFVANQRVPSVRRDLEKLLS